MAIMIPPEIPDNAPWSEKIIFKNLMHAPQARDWRVFHSQLVKQPKNTTKTREIDFIIVIPEGFSVICLEAKSGSYETRSKVWYRMPSREEVDSPLRQSKTAMHAFENELKPSPFRNQSLLSLGCAVTFIDGDLTLESVTRPHGESFIIDGVFIIEGKDARTPDKLCNQLATYTREMVRGKQNEEQRWIKKLTRDSSKYREAKIKAEEAVYRLQNYLEMDMTITPRPETITRAGLESLRPQLLLLTNDQRNSLKRVEINDRCVIDGAAGTGKTVLAMELARQLCEQGERVALLCSNPNLSRRFERWTETILNDKGGRVVAGTPTTLPLKAFGVDPALASRYQQRLDHSPNLEESLKFGYPDHNWKSFINETIKDLGTERIFDYLIVDEAQNLCDEVFLNLQDALLKDGLESGRWTLFGDFTNQNIISSQFGKDGRDALKVRGLNWSNDKLETNCRNTHEIAEAVAKFVDIESPPISGVHGPLVQIKYFESQETLGSVLDGLVCDLKDRKFYSRQIILLSSVSDGGFDAERLYGGWKLLNAGEAEEKAHKSLKDNEDVLSVSGDSSPKTLRYSDVYDFQGLESEVAILVLPVTDRQAKLAGGVALPQYEYLRRILYTGMSRAKAMLIIVAQESYKDFFEPPGL